MRLFLLFLLAVPVWLRAANPSFGDFSQNQFAINGNKVYIKSGATATNLAVTGTLTQNGSAPLTNTTLTGDVTTSGDAATIANNAVSYAKMQDISAASRLLGRGSAAGSGDPQELDIGSGLQISGTTLSATGTGVLATNGSAYAIVGGNALATNNWVALSNAYVSAKSATPHGLALGASNRFTIFLLPGTYDGGSATLTLDTLYIDIVGLSENTGAVQWSSAPEQGETIITSSGNTFVIDSTADGSSHDIKLANFCLKSSTSTTNSTLHVNQAGFGAKLYCKNINFVLTGSGNRVLPWSKNYAGTWEDCRAFFTRAWGALSGTLSGTWIRCKADSLAWCGDYSGTVVLSGTWIDCEGGSGSWAGSFGGGDATLSGMFVRCNYVFTQGADIQLFGGDNGTTTGTFIDCNTYPQQGFGAAPSSAIFIRCSSGGTLGWTTAPTGTILGCNFLGWGQPYAMNTADSTAIANTATETSFSLTKTILRGDWKIGRAFKWEAWGKFGTDAVTPGTLTLKLKFGTNVVNTTGAMTMLGAASNKGWTASGLFTCRTTGASGTVSSAMKAELDSAGFIGDTVVPSNGVSTNAMNASITMALSATWSVADADNTITMEQFLVHPQDTP